ncbi:MAG: glycosyltransferase family 2 protein [Clostridia bacterium]|nr:glycosyltransferase family 2 protein [Clostridia bacterium]
MRFTVFTPTYNRGYIIEQLYRSLQRQTFKDFEWVVVDDGSLDNTPALFEMFQAENNSFPIVYVRTENGGKHRAINKGIQIAHGELFYIVDSDDYLLDSALELMNNIEQTIPMEKKSTFCGICGIRANENKQFIGKTFDGDTLDITMLEREKHGITGDKAEAFYTDVLKQYQFPEFEEEKFLTECVVWDKIAYDGYKLRFFNEITMICEYRKDGLTAAGDSLFVKNPKGWGLYLYQCYRFRKIHGINKWLKYLEYYYALRDKHSFSKIAKNLHYPVFQFRIRLFFLKLFCKFYDR